MASTLFNFTAAIDRIEANVNSLTSAVAALTSQLTNHGEKIMALADDFHAALDDIQAAVDMAVSLIQSLHTGGPDAVSDADVQSGIDRLMAASAALRGAQPQP